MSRSICAGNLDRRKFLSGCACACAGCAAGGFLNPKMLRAGESTSGKPKVRLVFCEVRNDRPIWPHIGYDFDARRKQLTQILKQGCPEIDFVVTQLADDRKQAEAILKADGQVDGHIVFLLSMPRNVDTVKLCTTGKPTLFVDNLFGGSGQFLGRMQKIMGSGKPVDWVSSANDQDIVTSAKHFASLAQGKTPADVAKAFRATRHGRTPKDALGAVQEDVLSTPDFDATLKKLQQTKIVVVGGGRGGKRMSDAARDVVGVTFVPIKFEELAAAYDAADREAGRKIAEQWMAAAKEIVEPKPSEIEKSGAMYVAMRDVMKKHGAQGISINCLGGFYGGHLKAYPCLGFSQLNNDGLVGGCEADQMSALTMMTMGTLIGRPGFISDPVIDTSTNQIVYAHCVAPTKVFGPDGPTNPFRIRTHAEDKHGAAVQSLLPSGYMTSTLEINPVDRKVLFHQAKAAGNNPSELACRTKLNGVVRGDLEKLAEGWSMGWHRVTFFGDLKSHVIELCDRLKLELVEEA
ncbi:MAG: twin-arginine translocation signal domain-containing protein [Pirellulales bacterium]|nr:twin-arginine translocation signal domain-containing protein [Pirellulales bacterium]